MNGLSERSVRRFCATNGIRRYDYRVTGVEIHNVVTSAIAEVIVPPLYNITVLSKSQNWPAGPWPDQSF